jgi:hypothetical protein
VRTAVLVILASLALLVAEKLKREEKRRGQEAAAEKAKAEAIEHVKRVAFTLRADYHDKQRAAFTSRAKQKALKCTRRAGKTRGGCRETTARAVESRIRVLYCAATRDEAYARAWRTDTRDGWRDLVDIIGLKVATTRAAFDAGKGDVLVNESRLTLEFRNGSQLAIFAADRPEDADKLRGGEKDVVWIDEAQIFPSLTYFVEEVVDAMIAKPGGDRGEVWLSGTPDRNLAGLFFEVTKEPEQGERMAGWEVHEFAVIDNPYYGATAEERWDATAGKTLALKGWDPDDPPPQFVREWLGKWTAGDALFVYLVHKYVPEYLLPCRVDAKTGAYDHAAAVRDLPVSFVNHEGFAEGIVWYFALGVDFGGNPDPFAWSLAAFSPQIADIYEMGSWKQTDLTSDEMRDHLMALWEVVGVGLVVFRGDSSGALGKPTMEAWQESIGLPIEPADRHAKQAVMQMFNSELAARRFHYREDSPLLDEHRHLQWRVKKSPTGEGKRVEWADRAIRDPRSGEQRVPGNHCSDANLYNFRDLIARRLEFDVAPVTEADRLKREEQQLLASIRRDRSEGDEYGGWTT